MVKRPVKKPTRFGCTNNYVWLALPLTLGRIQQPINLSRLRRFKERPAYLGGSPTIGPNLALSDKWDQFCGTRMHRVSAVTLSEFCVGHELEFTLPPDYFRPDHYMYPFDGPRPVRVYDPWVEQGRKQVCIYLLGTPLGPNDAELLFGTAFVDVFAPAHTRPGENWRLMRALHFSFPDLVYLKDVLPNAKHSVVFRQNLVPIHTVVAARMAKGKDPIPEVLVQFTKTDYENSAWISEKFVTKWYLDDYWSRVESDGPPAPAHT